MGLQGRTLHKWLNLAIGNSPSAPWWEIIDFAKVPYQTIVAAQKACVLIVDEVQATYFNVIDCLDYFMRFARRTQVCFGGVPTFWFGDGKQKLITLPMKKPSPYDYLSYMISASASWDHVVSAKLVVISSSINLIVHQYTKFSVLNFSNNIIKNPAHNLLN